MDSPTMNPLVTLVGYLIRLVEAIEEDRLVDYIVAHGVTHHEAPANSTETQTSGKSSVGGSKRKRGDGDAPQDGEGGGRKTDKKRRNGDTSEGSRREKPTEISSLAESAIPAASESYSTRRNHDAKKKPAKAVTFKLPKSETSSSKAAKNTADRNQKMEVVASATKSSKNLHTILGEIGISKPAQTSSRAVQKSPSKSAVPTESARSPKVTAMNTVGTSDMQTQTEAPPLGDTSSSELQEMKNMLTAILSRFERISEVTEANSAALVMLADEVRQTKAKVEQMNTTVLDIKRETSDQEVKIEDVDES